MDPREQKSSFDITRVDYEYIERTNDKKELKKALAAMQLDSGFPHLEEALKQKLAKLDPALNRLYNQKPVTEEERYEIASDLNKFIEQTTNDDEALKGNVGNNIFENKKESAA